MSSDCFSHDTVLLAFSAFCWMPFCITLLIDSKQNQRGGGVVGGGSTLFFAMHSLQASKIYAIVI